MDGWLSELLQIEGISRMICLNHSVRCKSILHFIQSQSICEGGHLEGNLVQLNRQAHTSICPPAYVSHAKWIKSLHCSTRQKQKLDEGGGIQVENDLLQYYSHLNFTFWVMQIAEAYTLFPHG